MASAVVLGTDQQSNLRVSRLMVRYIHSFLLKMTHLTQMTLRPVPEEISSTHSLSPSAPSSAGAGNSAAWCFYLGIISNLEPDQDFLDDQQQQLQDVLLLPELHQGGRQPKPSPDDRPQALN